MSDAHGDPSSASVASDPTFVCATSVRASSAGERRATSGTGTSGGGGGGGARAGGGGGGEGGGSGVARAVLRGGGHGEATPGSHAAVGADAGAERLPPSLWQAGDPHVDPLAPEGDALGLEQRPLARALGQRAVRADDPVPRHR